jgi:hypothetical protein
MGAPTVMKTFVKSTVNMHAPRPMRTTAMQRFEIIVTFLFTKISIMEVTGI